MGDRNLEEDGGRGGGAPKHWPTQHMMSGSIAVIGVGVVEMLSTMTAAKNAMIIRMSAHTIMVACRYRVSHHPDGHGWHTAYIPCIIPRPMHAALASGLRAYVVPWYTATHAEMAAMRACAPYSIRVAMRF